MTKEEWVNIVKVLKASYTNDKFIPDRESNLVWYEMLKDLAAIEVKKAVIEYVASEHFPPTIADIRTRVIKSRKPIGNWAVSWQKIIKLIGSCGRNGYKEAMGKLDAIEQKCVDSMGWYNLCTSENINYMANTFKTIYDDMSNEEFRQALLPVRNDRMLEG